MKTYTLTFSGAGTKELPGGNFFMIISASSTVDVLPWRAGSPLDNEKAEAVEAGFYIERKDWSNEALELSEQGRGKRKLRHFDSIQITSASAQTVKVAISQGTGGYARVTGVVESTKANTLTPLTDAVCNTSVATQVSAQADTKRQVLLRNLNTNGITLRVGSSAVTALIGIDLRPDEQITLETSAAVYCFNPSGAATEQVSILEIHD